MRCWMGSSLICSWEIEETKKRRRLQRLGALSLPSSFYYEGFFFLVGREDLGVLVIDTNRKGLCVCL